MKNKLSQLPNLNPDPLDLCPQADQRGCNLANGSGVKLQVTNLTRGKK